MAPPTVFVALAVLCLATILSVIGLVTMDWEISESALGVAINSTEYEGREIVVYRKGLWQECISPAAPVSEADGICSKVFRKNVSCKCCLRRFLNFSGMFIIKPLCNPAVWYAVYTLNL